eukprot:TRINITY_DN8691_c0_g2_i1.p1 TRINITY_DN8691_c0_g2~~TRINITY_DN8691_c0_g2_i1.p1  ORF type:complete len:783 (+),score=135.59 TRINITY_DN8691_c0_g2_i1:320-2350(+)
MQGVNLSTVRCAAEKCRPEECCEMKPEVGVAPEPVYVNASKEQQDPKVVQIGNGWRQGPGACTSTSGLTVCKLGQHAGWPACGASTSLLGLNRARSCCGDLAFGIGAVAAQHSLLWSWQYCFVWIAPGKRCSDMVGAKKGFYGEWSGTLTALGEVNVSARDTSTAYCFADSTAKTVHAQPTEDRNPQAECSTFATETACPKPRCAWWEECMDVPKKWPDGVVPFFLDRCELHGGEDASDDIDCGASAEDARPWVQEAMRRIEAVSCIKFKEIADPLAAPGNATAERTQALAVIVERDVPRLRIFVPAKWTAGSDDERSTFCNGAADVGASTTAFMAVSEACNHYQVQFPAGVPALVHELMHVLGFRHEHVRPDRNSQLTVNEDNIDTAEMTKFAIRPGIDWWNIVGGSDKWFDQLDFTSIMMYNSFQESRDEEKPTMTRKNGSTWCASRRLSPADVARLQSYYGCQEGLAGCEGDDILDGGKLCTCKAKHNLYGLKCGGCTVRKQCENTKCQIENECDVPKTCDRPRECSKPKSCKVKLDSKNWWKVWDHWEMIKDGAKCGWERVKNGAECGWSRVTSATDCGVEHVKSAALCGFKEGFGVAECGYQQAKRASNCGREWVKDAGQCGGTFVACGADKVEASINYAKSTAKCGWDGATTVPRAVASSLKCAVAKRVT